MQHQKVPPPSRLVGAPHAILARMASYRLPHRLQRSGASPRFRARWCHPSPRPDGGVFPEMNHLFVHDPVGFPGNYTKLVNPRVEPEVVGAVAEWLLKRMR